jgi:drug/metabolite transporter (DMT)-like permease
VVATPAPDDARRRPLYGASLLLVAAVVWGFAFVPQKLTVLGLGPLQATAVRFVLAAPLPLLLANRRLRKPGVSLASAALLGVILVVIYALQTAALVYAPVARVSLITGMYAVFTPLFAPLVGHARPTWLHWTGALLAFAGLLALTGVVGAGDDLLSVPLNRGDAFVLLHAVITAFQVLLVGKLARTADPLALNALQLVVVAAIAVPLALVVEGMPDLHAIEPRTWASFGYLAVFSTVIAFTCQILGQRHTSPPTAAVIMLLETPIGVLGALLFFDERMGPLQWVGAGVVVAGVAASLVAELRRTST